MKTLSERFSAIAILVSLVVLPIHEASAENSAEADVALPEIQVMGQTPGSGVQDFVPTVSKISGNELERKKQTTIGETLAREPGVSSSFYGPNASRPIIRGLDGEKIKLLENGVGIDDASGTSPDHAVSTDPLTIDSVEIVRGPSALLYGSGAIGGVINLRDTRIADHVLNSSDLKLSGRLSSVDHGRSLGAILRYPFGKSWILEMDGSLRGAEDYSIPGFARSSYLRANDAPGDDPGDREKVTNSASRFGELGLGISHVDENGHYGLAISGIKNDYGTVAEKTVTIDLQRFRLDFDSEFKTKPESQSWVKAVGVKGAASVYRHQEIDEGEIGTTFRNKGGELRVDVKHAKTGAMEGLFGAQAQYFNFSALGDEAFIPTTHNLSTALFGFEEWKIGKLKPSLGLRADRASVASVDPDVTKFGPAQTKDFFVPSISAGALYSLDPETSAGLNLTYTERAPNYEELFANGPHLATDQWEIGDPSMPIERSFGVEASLRRKNHESEGRLSVYAQSFSSFIALSPTGGSHPSPDDPSEQVPDFRYNSVSALLFGSELEYRHELPIRLADGRFELGGTFDFVRGLDRSHHDWLPRMSPFRESLTLDYRNRGWLGEIELQRSEKQNLLAANELPTDAFTFINLGVEAPIATSFGQYRLMARVNNVFDHEGRVATSVLKDIAPLPGRNFIIGLQAAL